ncbi:MAG: putative DNA binding domain-containing protein, partial [Muribaculaceae bacterium]|nr:putative DNA binding domain-containing protein [Muribaculaceae bacterium]
MQFKRLFKTAEDIANELVAFSNSRGGSIFVGIDDKTGEIVGLDFSQLQALGSLVASAADDRMHPVVYPEIETVLVDGKAVMIITVPKGWDAPYTNKKGEIYVKQGCDKRRVTDNNEILRLFANSGTFQPDRQSIRGTSINDIDTFALEEFFERTLHKSPDDLGLPLKKALQNLFILDEEEQLTLGGLMYFGKQPQRYCQAFDMKAVWFYGNSIGGTEYRDSKDILGTIPEMFEQGMRFIESCLHRRQGGQNFNSIGILEIPEVSLKEILQNALVHRSWLKPAPIRLLIFDDRVEIISPGALPPTLTVDDIKLGNAFQRNQLIANLCAKTMDYRGLGSGIIRALQADANIEFHNEVSGDQFRVILRRPTQKTESKEETTQKTESKEESKEETTQKTESKEESKEQTTQKDK